MNIGKALKDVRRLHKDSQQDTCNKVGITQTYLSQVESGLKIPSIEVINKIATVYQIPFPVMMWFTLTENDVREDKRELYDKFKKTIDDLINEIFVVSKMENQQ